MSTWHLEVHVFVICSRQRTALLNNTVLIPASAVPSIAPTITGNVSQSNSSIQVTWNTLSPVDLNGNLTGYTVRYRVTSSSDIYETKVVSAGTNTLIITGLQIYTNYSVSVRAASQAGPGPYSSDSIQQTDQGSKSF